MDGTTYGSNSARPSTLGQAQKLFPAIVSRRIFEPVGRIWDRHGWQSGEKGLRLFSAASARNIHEVQPERSGGAASMLREVVSLGICNALPV